MMPLDLEKKVLEAAEVHRMPLDLEKKQLVAEVVVELNVQI